MLRTCTVPHPAFDTELSQRELLFFTLEVPDQLGHARRLVVLHSGRHFQMHEGGIEPPMFTLRERVYSPPTHNQQRPLVLIQVSGRNRTCDPGVATRRLVPLGYGHIQVGGGGVEPPTFRLSDERSHQLSYPPMD